jgi:hypothetical protein
VVWRSLSCSPPTRFPVPGIGFGFGDVGGGLTGGVKVGWTGAKLGAGAWLAGLISGLVFEAEGGWDGEDFWTTGAGFGSGVGLGLVSGVEVADDRGFEALEGSARNSNWTHIRYRKFLV